ncbi:Hypothetical protein A7982_05484 [Minicystis rosea]|nr:Hypothetical protein A7982_05484 [Minicystis rosea]
MRAVLAMLAVPVVAVACTFPDVDYVDSGDAGPITTCAVPTNCANDTKPCVDDVQHMDETCRKPCQNDSTCLADCDANRQTGLRSCAAACESCGAPSCGEKPMNCDALVGL